MRFGALPALAVLSASIVVASPIRVVVTEVSSTGVRYGHATADIAAVPFTGHPIELLNAPAVNSDALPTHRRPGCQGMRSKALEASNALRQWLGLEPIKPNQGGPRIHHAHHMSGEGPVVVKFSDGNKTGGDIPVLPFVGTPVRPAFVPEGEDRWTGPPPMWVHRHQHFRGSFLRRVHHALMSLGPWEGRAVAFVLGCGIGVLLRMVWVIALVTARAIRGQREDDHEYDDVVFDEAEAEMLVPPPQYTIIEGTEAVPVPVDEKADKN